MSAPKDMFPDDELSAPELNYKTDPETATSPHVPPVPGAVQESGNGKQAPEQVKSDGKGCTPPPVAEDKLNTDSAFSFPMHVLLGIKEDIASGQPSFQHLKGLLGDKSGFADLYMLYDRAGFNGIRDLGKWILSAQAVQGVALDQVIMGKIINQCQSQDSSGFMALIQLRHRNNADVRSALELMDRLSHLPAKPNPGIKINVAALQQIRSEKQDV